VFGGLGHDDLDYVGGGGGGPQLGKPEYLISACSLFFVRVILKKIQFLYNILIKP